MNRNTPAAYYGSYSVPRTRGDEPANNLTLYPHKERSPHPRG